MARVEVGFAELHADLFLGGKNLSKKLDSNRHGGLKMEFDEDRNELLVTWNNQTGHIPHANICCYVPGKPMDRKVVQMASPMVAGVSSAQVQTPMGHVHAGQGHGKTGK